MTKLFLTAATTAVLVMAGMAFADSENWDDAKTDQVLKSRGTNSGLALGLTKQGKEGAGEWYAESQNQVYFDMTENYFPADDDPGNSGAQCQGGKNLHACAGQ